MAKHAFLSASSAHRWTRCLAAPWREKDLPDVSSPYAEEGTKAHELLEQVLTGAVKHNRRGKYYPDDMREYIQTVAERVYSAAAGGDIHAEQQLSIESITTEKNATGTADVVIVKYKELIVIDLKYGMGLVAAEDNEQLMIYGAAALEEADLLGEIETITLGVGQPRLGHFDEWTLPADELRRKIIPIRKVAKEILTAEGRDTLPAVPGAVQCKFCKASGTCPEYRAASLAVVTDDFVDLDKEELFLKKVENAALRLPASDDKHLSTCMDAVDMIENWCKAVRREVESRLVDGTFTDPRYKLVQGRKGHRRWRDESVDEYFLQHALKDEVFEYKLKSPAQVERILKNHNDAEKIREEHVIQAEGKPSVASAKDKRDALQIKDMFTNLDKEDPEFIDALIGLTKEGE